MSEDDEDRRSNYGVPEAVEAELKGGVADDRFSFVTSILPPSHLDSERTSNSPRAPRAVDNTHESRS